MTRKRCCCGDSCPQESCEPTWDDCANVGLAGFSIDVTATARIPTCEVSVCNIGECESGLSPGDVYVYRTGCLPCNIYTCTPCESFPTYGPVKYYGFITTKSGDPTTDNATCDYVWATGYRGTERICGPTPEFKCLDNVEIIDGGCAILPYKTITRKETFTLTNFDNCTGGAAGALPKSTDHLYGHPCDSCGTTPPPCCADGSCTCDCHSIRMPGPVVMEGINVPKQGIIYATILEMVPCSTTPSSPFKPLCGQGCTGATGHSQITIEFRAIVPTKPMPAREVFVQTCLDTGAGTPGPGKVMLPLAQSLEDLEQGDEDGDFWCVAETGIVVTFRCCRTTANSFENKCRMQSGIYHPFYVGIGSCPNLSPCNGAPGNGCDVSSINQYLQSAGWGFSVVVA